MQDHIEKTIDLNAPIKTVWHALTDYREFGSWFRVKLENPFEPGKATRGLMLNEECAGMIFWAKTLRMEAPGYFSFRWPHDEQLDPDQPHFLDKSTPVEFILQRHGEGTRLTLRESEFSTLPEDIRAGIIESHNEGWTEQLENIRVHVDG